MPLRLFRSREVTGANLVMALMVVGFFGMFFLGALYMQGILGYSALEVGLAFLPSALVMGGLSLGYAEKLVMGFGARRSLLTGLVLIAIGLLLFARAPVDGNYLTDILPVMLFLGTGAGVSFPAMMTLAMSGATDQDAGLASGFVNTTVQVAGAIGLAVLATLASERSDTLAAAGESAAEALNGGYHLAYLVGAGLVVVAVGVALTVLRPDEKQADEQSADPVSATASPPTPRPESTRGRAPTRRRRALNERLTFRSLSCGSDDRQERTLADPRRPGRGNPLRPARRPARPRRADVPRLHDPAQRPDRRREPAGGPLRRHRVLRRQLPGHDPPAPEVPPVREDLRRLADQFEGRLHQGQPVLADQARRRWRRRWRWRTAAAAARSAPVPFAS